MNDWLHSKDTIRKLTANEKKFLEPVYSNIRELWQSEWRENHQDAVVVYVLRHGESISNLKKITQTRNYVSPLTLHGIRQAKAAAVFLDEVPFDIFISSGAERSYHSLSFLWKLKGHKKPTCIDTGLSEINMFPVGGVPTHLAKHVFDPDQVYERYPESFKNLHLQSLNGYMDEIQNFYTELLNRPGINGKTVILSSHGGSMLFQLMMLGNIPVRKMVAVRNIVQSKGHCPNAGCHVYAYLPEEKRWQVLVLNDNTYLPSYLQRQSSLFYTFLTDVYANFQVIFRRLKYITFGRKQHPSLQDYYPTDDHWYWSLCKPKLKEVKNWRETFLKQHPNREVERLSLITLHRAYPIVRIDNIAINLTNWCPVGCAFCFIKAVSQRKKQLSLEPESITGVLNYAKQWCVPRLDLSGGEALDAIESVLRIINEADVKTISITTSGYFATNEERIESIFDRLAQALEMRMCAKKNPIRMFLYLSVDEFHTSVPFANVYRIIKVFEKYQNKYSNITLELRAIMTSNDPIPKLISEIGGQMTEPSMVSYFPTMKIRLPSGYEFTVKYGEVKILKEMIHTELSNKQYDQVYVKRLKEDVIYIGRGKQNGASIDVSFNGVVTIQEYLADDLPLGNANKENGFDEVNFRIMFDPLVVALREIGLNTVLDIASHLRPNIREQSIKANNMFLAVSDILQDHDLSIYVYRELIPFIEKYYEEKSCHEDWIPLNIPRPVYHYDNMYVELTNYCTVGCSFCFMKSVSNPKMAIRLQPEAINRILNFIKEKSIPLLNLTGGEPLFEMDTVLQFIREAEVEKVTIATSGYFAVNESRTEEILDLLTVALQHREKAGKKPIKIDFRISTDQFHWHLTSKVLPNIINTFTKFFNSKYRGITLAFLGIMSKDDPMPNFIGKMGGVIFEEEMAGTFPTKKIVFPSGFSVEIKYGEMKIPEDQMETDLAISEFDRVYKARLTQEIIYIGRGEKGGASVSVSHDGAVSQQEFLSRKFSLTSVYSKNFPEEIEYRLTRDPLVVALRDVGLNTILDIAAQLRPKIRERSIKTNNQFLAVLDIIEDKELKNFVYQKLIQLLERNNINFTNARF